MGDRTAPSSDFLALIAMNPQAAADAHERAMAEVDRLRGAIREHRRLTTAHALHIDDIDADLWKVLDA